MLKVSVKVGRIAGEFAYTSFNWNKIEVNLKSFQDQFKIKSTRLDKAAVQLFPAKTASSRVSSNLEVLKLFRRVRNFSATFARKISAFNRLASYSWIQLMTSVSVKPSKAWNYLLQNAGQNGRNVPEKLWKNCESDLVIRRASRFLELWTLSIRSDPVHWSVCPVRERRRWPSRAQQRTLIFKPAESSAIAGRTMRARDVHSSTFGTMANEFFLRSMHWRLSTWSSSSWNFAV